MRVERINPSGQRVETVRDMPLTNIWFEKDACNDRIILNFEQEGKREVMHEIVEPIHIKLREEGEGQKGLQIDAENGSTLVLFRSGKIPELIGALGAEAIA